MALYCPDHSGTKRGLATIPVSCPTCIVATLRAELEDVNLLKECLARENERLSNLFIEWKHRAEEDRAALKAVIDEGTCLSEVALGSPDTEIEEGVDRWNDAVSRALRNASEEK